VPSWVYFFIFIFRAVVVGVEPENSRYEAEDNDPKPEKEKSVVYKPELFSKEHNIPHGNGENVGK